MTNFFLFLSQKLNMFGYILQVIFHKKLEMSFQTSEKKKKE